MITLDRSLHRLAQNTEHLSSFWQAKFLSINWILIILIDKEQTYILLIYWQPPNWSVNHTHILRYVSNISKRFDAIKERPAWQPQAFLCRRSFPGSCTYRAVCCGAAAAARGKSRWVHGGFHNAGSPPGPSDNRTHCHSAHSRPHGNLSEVVRGGKADAIYWSRLWSESRPEGGEDAGRTLWGQIRDLVRRRTS